VKSGWKIGLAVLILGASVGSPMPCRAQATGSQEKESPKGTVATAMNEAGQAGAKPPSGKQGTLDGPDPGVYHIGVEDDLQITVWKEPEISTSVVVRPDGMITVPLLNDVYVLGLQTSELQALLTEKLKPFVNEPQVTIIVRGIKSRKVYVYGQVAKPGAYQLVGRKTVLEVLSESGGLSLFAKKGSIYVLRNINNKKTKLPFNYNNALKGKDPNDNFELFPGDIIVVP
jgi:polysaccharide export outer membrane protein